MAQSDPGTAEEHALELTWLGTAGFEIRLGDQVILIDPYLSRNPRARPVQDLRPGDMRGAERIFISHGHFDHLLDVPRIAAALKATVFCDRVAARSLIREGFPEKRIVRVDYDGQTFEFPGFRARAGFSRHVKFDLPLILRTLARANVRLPGLRPLVRNYPTGQVLSWRFDYRDRSILHFGSAGSSKQELERLADQQPDVLLVPLQGHSAICEIALEYVRVLRPKTVIPHHHDDFYPPVSMMVDPDPFLKGLEREFPEVKAIVPRMNRGIVL